MSSLVRGRRRTAVVACCSALAALGVGTAVGQEGSPVDDVRPAPGAFGTDVPVTYQGPPPSSVRKELIGPHELVRAGDYDLEQGTVTMPLYRGEVGASRRAVWYILTDTSDRDEADSLGLNFSPKLKYGDVDLATRKARLVKGNMLRFDSGTVDFSPERRIAPGTGMDAYPPSVADPGSRGSETYSPLVKVRNTRTVYNAPVVSMASPEELQAMTTAGTVDHAKVHDKVVAVDYAERTVTLELTTGFSFSRPILYLSTDANDPAVATLEASTFAPGLQDVTVGGDDGAFSAVERIFIASNGPTGAEHPQRQGLNSALVDGRSPLNVFGGIPTIATDYSPLWDANIYTWTKASIDKGYRARETEEFRILGLAQQGPHHRPGRQAVRLGRRHHQLPADVPAAVMPARLAQLRGPAGRPARGGRPPRGAPRAGRPGRARARRAAAPSAAPGRRPPARRRRSRRGRRATSARAPGARRRPPRRATRPGGPGRRGGGRRAARSWARRRAARRPGPPGRPRRSKWAADAGGRLVVRTRGGLSRSRHRPDTGSFPMPPSVVAMLRARHVHAEVLPDLAQDAEHHLDRLHVLLARAVGGMDLADGLGALEPERDDTGMLRAQRHLGHERQAAAGRHERLCDVVVARRARDAGGEAGGRAPVHGEVVAVGAGLDDPALLGQLAQRRARAPRERMAAGDDQADRDRRRADAG
jgi:hypothetical protein